MKKANISIIPLDEHKILATVFDPTTSRFVNFELAASHTSILNRANHRVSAQSTLLWCHTFGRRPEVDPFSGRAIA